MKCYNYIICVLFFFCGSQVYGQSKEVFSADEFYNLGNAAYAEDRFDDAIYYYEKAKLLDPGGKDIATNLQLANEQLSTDIIELEPFFLASWWNSLCGLLLPGGWKVISILCLLGLLALVFFYLFRSLPKDKNVFYTLLGVLLTVFIISMFAGTTRSKQIFHSPYAIVYGEDQSLYLGPDSISETVKDVTGGNKLRILDEIEGWYKVSAMDSEQGWIKKENVKLIKF